jgi:hypothetical protein
MSKIKGLTSGVTAAVLVAGIGYAYAQATDQPVRTEPAPTTTAPAQPGTSPSTSPSTTPSTLPSNNAATSPSQGAPSSSTSSTTTRSSAADPNTAQPMDSLQRAPQADRN